MTCISLVDTPEKYLLYNSARSYLSDEDEKIDARLDFIIDFYKREEVYGFSDKK